MHSVCLCVSTEVSDLDTKNGVSTDEKGKATRLSNHIKIVECTDANGNTPLSEAAGGGHAHAIKMLIENGADPNSKVRNIVGGRKQVNQKRPQVSQELS